MTIFQIVALYIALNIILAVFFTYRVISVRIGNRVSMGDNGDTSLLARIRTHGNFTENAPMALLGLLGLAMLNAPVILLHIFGSMFIFGRVLHAFGMAGKHALGKTRPIGMMITLIVHLGQAIALLYLVFTFNVI